MGKERCGVPMAGLLQVSSSVVPQLWCCDKSFASGQSSIPRGEMLGCEEGVAVGEDSMGLKQQWGCTVTPLVQRANPDGEAPLGAL